MISLSKQKNRALALMSLVIAGGMFLSACSSDHDSMDMEPVNGNANAADVMFAQMMIPHHEQAISMADYAPGRASDPAVIALALEIKAAQDPEIELMKSWLTTWGISEMSADDAMQDHSAHGMDGMLTADQLADLSNSQGQAFDKLFTALMIEHHEGAIAMAQDVLSAGQDPAVLQLAQEIIAQQESEILKLQTLLDKGSGASVEGDQALSSNVSENQFTNISPALSHIHGAIAQSDALLIGTHHGVYRIELATGTTQMVGDSQNDMMGFAGDPTTLLMASGHPGEGSSMPNPLGLISSTDGGLTWNTISLSGMVDFHTLAVKENEVVGWDTQGFIRYSADSGRTWSEGPRLTATSVAWFEDLVWIASAEEGLASWKPGSTSISPVGMPTVLVATSPDGKALWRIDQDGSVHRTLDALTWKNHGAISRIDAFAAEYDKAYAITGNSVETIRAS